MSRLAEIVRDAVDRKLAEGRTTAGDIAMFAQREHAEEISDESERLVRNALHSQIKRELSRRAEDDDGQDALPGLGLPSAIYVPSASDDYYVARDAATFEELVAGREVRVDNIRHANQRLAQYDDALDRLRPYMEGTTRSVAEAVRAMQADAA